MAVVVLVSAMENMLWTIFNTTLGHHFHPHSANGVGITAPILSAEKASSEGEVTCSGSYGGI